jgi:hypothetical protein
MRYVSSLDLLILPFFASFPPLFDVHPSSLSVHANAANTLSDYAHLAALSSSFDEMTAATDRSTTASPQPDETDTDGVAVEYEIEYVK